MLAMAALKAKSVGRRFGDLPLVGECPKFGNWLVG
jgi:hypothetical protein